MNTEKGQMFLQCLKGDYKREGEGFYVAGQGGMALNCQKFGVDIKKKFFIRGG